MPADTDDSSPTLSANGEKRWRLAMLRVYADATKAHLAKAEDLIAQALAMREEALAMITRAETISRELAQILDTPEPPSSGTVVAEEDIPW